MCNLYSITSSQSATRPVTGWLQQHPELANRLHPVEGLISRQDIVQARQDWGAACVRTHQYAIDRARELAGVARIHRDSFAAILVVLNNKSPLSEYKKIADEILRHLPSEGLYPRAVAEGIRAYLLFRFGMHLGLRQRNLRDLLVCHRGDQPRQIRQLEDRECGELRWNDSEQGWEVFIPASAFKNSTSPFFSGRPYCVPLPDLENLYGLISDYLARHRPVIIGPALDVGTFFVMGASAGRPASFGKNDLCRFWREIIQRYGIYNPYTGRGAIKGLLPHGPHSIRDVLATHILKQTGSYELASYAIQDTPETVFKHYGWFLPQDKSAQAAKISNRVWESDSFDTTNAGTGNTVPSGLRPKGTMRPYRRGI